MQQEEEEDQIKKLKNDKKWNFIICSIFFGEIANKEQTVPNNGNDDGE